MDAPVQLSCLQPVKDSGRMADPMARPDPRAYSQRFGTAAYLKRYVTLQQLHQALSEQVDDNVSGRPHRLLGQILRQRNWITEDQETEILTYLDSLEK